MINEGDTVTGPLPDGTTATGTVTEAYDHDVEGRAYPGGRVLTVQGEGREWTMRASRVTAHVPAQRARR